MKAKLTTEQRADFKKLINILGKQNAVIANAINIKTVSFSERTRIKGSAAFSKEEFTALKHFIKSQIEKNKQTLNDKKQLNIVHNLYADIFEAIQLPYIMPQDGISLPIQAINYIKRPADDKLRCELNKGAKIIFLTGGVQSGISSLMQGQQAFIELLEAKYIYISLSINTSLYYNYFITLESLIKTVIREIIGVKKSRVLKTYDEKDTISGFKVLLNQWYKAHYKNKQPVIIFIDHLTKLLSLSNLNPYLVETDKNSAKEQIQAINTFIIFLIEQVVNINWLHLVISFNPYVWLDEKISKYQSRGVNIYLDKFSYDVIEQLIPKVLSITKTQRKVISDYCYHTFGPYPYIVGLFIDKIYNKIDVLGFEKAFKLYKERYDTLLQLIEKEMSNKLKEILTAPDETRIGDLIIKTEHKAELFYLYKEITGFIHCVRKVLQFTYLYEKSISTKRDQENFTRYLKKLLENPRELPSSLINPLQTQSIINFNLNHCEFYTLPHKIALQMYCELKS